MNVSVLMSIYHKEDASNFKMAMESLAAQTSKPSEIILVHDGKLTKSLYSEIGKWRYKLNISEIKLETNQGLSKALNIGIAACSYDLIARFDTDDICRPERFEKQVEFLKNNPDVDVVGTSCKEFGSSFSIEKHLPKTHEELVNFSITRCPFIHPSVMFRKSVLLENKYPEDSPMTEDMALWCNLLKKGYRFANINEVLIDYRMNESTVERRKGFGKALSEVRIRLDLMVSLKKVSIKNISLILARLVFHVMPTPLVKLAYKKVR